MFWLLSESPTWGQIRSLLSLWILGSRITKASWCSGATGRSRLSRLTGRRGRRLTFVCMAGRRELTCVMNPCYFVDYLPWSQTIEQLQVRYLRTLLLISKRPVDLVQSRLCEDPPSHQHHRRSYPAIDSTALSRAPYQFTRHWPRTEHPPRNPDFSQPIPEIDPKREARQSLP